MTRSHPALIGRGVYLDYNATTPVDPRVVDAITSVLRHEFGNPSSAHEYGQTAAGAMARARAQVLRLLNGTAGRLIFTGSGSEADALAIKGAVTAQADAVATPHVITQATEHPAVLAACAELHAAGIEVTVLSVDSDGRLDPDAVRSAIRAATVLVSVMHANNETGTIQPIAEIARVAHEHGALMHCDAAQSVGKVPVDVQELGVDMLTVVGHKMYAPKGVAALFVRDGVGLQPLVAGGGQEYGFRAGTENVAYIVGMGVAAELASEALAAGEGIRLASLRDLLENRLRAELPGRVLVNGDPLQRLPNTSNLSVEGLVADNVFARIAASAGSACHAGQRSPSPVLTAMGLSAERCDCAVRFSFGRWSTESDVHRAVDAVVSAV